jgi:Clp amino terminal domain, pathogenicity island component
VFERLDPAARRVLDMACRQAGSFGHNYVGTEHVLLALTIEDSSAADVLTDHGCRAEQVRAEIEAIIGAGPARRQPEMLLASLGIDLAEVRRRVETTFGADAVARAAWRATPRRRWHGRRWWPNCTMGQPSDSALVGGRWLGMAPRLKRIIEAAVKLSAPQPPSPLHLLLAVVGEGQGVACRILARRGVDLPSLAASARALLD